LGDPEEVGDPEGRPQRMRATTRVRPYYTRGWCATRCYGDRASARKEMGDHKGGVV